MMIKRKTQDMISFSLNTMFWLPEAQFCWLNTFNNIGAADVWHMDDDEEDKEEKHSDSAEAVLHEFTYKIKNYFMESERGLRATWL